MKKVMKKVMYRQRNDLPNSAIYSVRPQRSIGWEYLSDDDIENMVFACDGESQDTYMSLELLREAYGDTAEFVQIPQRGEFLNFRYTGTERRMEQEFASFDIYVSCSTAGRIDRIGVPANSEFPHGVVSREEFQAWYDARSWQEGGVFFPDLLLA